MRSVAAMSLVVLVLAGGCGGHDDRPDVAAPTPPATEAQVPTPVATTSEAAAASASPGSARGTTSRERGAIVTQAGVAEAAIRRWNGSVDSCVGSSGTGDDAGASCTRAAWDQLFDQMYAVKSCSTSWGGWRATGAAKVSPRRSTPSTASCRELPR